METINNELLQQAIEQCDGCMDETQVEPEDAAAWKVVRAALAQRAGSSGAKPVAWHEDLAHDGSYLVYSRLEDAQKECDLFNSYERSRKDFDPNDHEDRVPVPLYSAPPSQPQPDSERDAALPVTQNIAKILGELFSEYSTDVDEEWLDRHVTINLNHRHLVVIVDKLNCQDADELYAAMAAAQPDSERDAALRHSFLHGVIAALGAMAPHHKHGDVVHDEVVMSVGKADLYRAAEPEDVEWAALDPEYYAAMDAQQGEKGGAA